MLIVEHLYGVFKFHLPAIHLSTWTLAGKPAAVVAAMQVCGAQFVKTREARRFAKVYLDKAKSIALQELVCLPILGVLALWLTGYLVGIWPQ